MPTFIFSSERTCSVAVVLFDVTLACSKIIGRGWTKTSQFVGIGLNSLFVSSSQIDIFFLIVQTGNGLGKYFLSSFFCIVCQL